jgi:membrane protein YdbS with pleckstrin-like domain
MAVQRNHDVSSSPPTGASNGQAGEEPVRWSAFPSWKHFIWLYMFSAMAVARGLILLRSETSAWEFWFGGAVLLLVCAAILRRWARYILTPHRIIVRNGYTGREISVFPVDRIADVTIEQGPLASFFDIGTVVLRTHTDDPNLVLRGVPEPEALRARIDALRPRSQDREGLLGD